MRLTLIAGLSALLVAGGLAAQIAPVQMQRPVIVQPNVQAPTAPTAQTSPEGQLTYEDSERLKEALNKLRREKLALRNQLAVTLADLQTLRIELDETTRKGGERVTAFCASDELSRNTAGAEENCAASGYRCAEVTGLCHRQCGTTSMCAPGYVCDMGAPGRCIVPPVSDDRCTC